MYSNVVRELWKDNFDYIKPSTFFNFCGRLNSTFRDPGQQEDTQEFFSFVVDCLHEDFNASWAKPPLRALTTEEEATREATPRLLVAKMEWNRYTHRENSFITSLFYGLQSSRVRCTHCNTTSTQYDPWALLQIEIPETREAHLQDCLRNHFQDELLDADNLWTCTTCQQPRRATKQLTITRAPPILVVGLKRFKTHPRTGDQRKIHTAVRFPLEGLDMQEFILPQPDAKESELIVAKYGGPQALKTDAALTPPYIYDAYAVVRHQGDTTRSGHYTAAVRDKARGCWRFFNDTASNDFRPEGLPSAKALDNDQAYLVFYQRRGLGGEK
jgi:ubiquitin carboxyl-terminal hydrolase 8